MDINRVRTPVGNGYYLFDGDLESEKNVANITEYLDSKSMPYKLSAHAGDAWKLLVIGPLNPAHSALLEQKWAGQIRDLTQG